MNNWLFINSSHYKVFLLSIYKLRQIPVGSDSIVHIQFLCVRMLCAYSCLSGLCISKRSACLACVRVFALHTAVAFNACPWCRSIFLPSQQPAANLEVSWRNEITSDGIDSHLTALTLSSQPGSDTDGQSGKG